MPIVWFCETVLNVLLPTNWFCFVLSPSDIPEEWAKRWKGELAFNSDLHLPEENKFIGQCGIALPTITDPECNNMEHTPQWPVTK